MTAFLQPINYMTNEETDPRIDTYGQIIQGDVENTIFQVGTGRLKRTPIPAKHTCMYPLYIQPIRTCKAATQEK